MSAAVEALLSAPPVAGRADLIARFRRTGRVDVSQMEVNDAVDLVFDLGVPTDELRVKDGVIIRSQSLTLTAPCALTREQVIAGGSMACKCCRISAVMHRSERDPIVVKGLRR